MNSVLLEISTSVCIRVILWGVYLGIPLLKNDFKFGHLPALLE